MRSGESGGIELSPEVEPDSPVTGGSAQNSPRRSSSPAEASPNRVQTRKRTNTASSGSGDRRTANKICRVCGDKAFSYNFNVITCESCKAFFRRNAIKEKEIRCPFSENCEINVLSRRFCQRCRLSKCFEVGMKKEWIMSEEARMEKKQRVEENRERRLLDAMRSEGAEMSPVRERMRSESKTEDESSQMAIDPPPQPPPIEEPKSVPRIVEEQMMPPFPTTLPPFPEALTNSAVPEYNPNFAVGSVHNMLDSIPTTAAHSLADVSSTTSAIQSIDTDSSSTMGGMGFIPPVIESSAASCVSALLPVSVTNAVGNSIMAAQAQLAVQAAQVQAAQVQAAQAVQAQQAQAVQQIAAAVVAHQVAAHIAAAPPQTIAPPLSHSLQAPIPATLPPSMPSMPVLPPAMPVMPQAMPAQLQPLQPTLQQTLPTNILAPTLAPPAPTLLQTLGTPMDMVTIPREMLVQLIENNMKRTASCTCQCVCGRYPQGTTIVDEVTKDLLAAGNQQNACNSCEQKDEARLETTEDFQVNGLMPSEDSSIQWLNSSQPTVVDPTTLSDNPYPAAVDHFPLEIKPILDDSEIHTLTVYDREVLSEVEASNRNWRSNGHPRMENGNHLSYLRQDTSSHDSTVQARVESTVRELVRASNTVACFRGISPLDRMALIRERALAYLIMRGAQLYDPLSNQWIDADSWPIVYEVQRECAMIYSSLGEAKNSDQIVAVLSLLCLFDPDTGVLSRDDVAKENSNLVGLLKRLLYNRFKEESRVREECAHLLNLLPRVRELASRCGPAFKFDPVRVEGILHETL